jgi:hypothetical protein
VLILYHRSSIYLIYRHLVRYIVSYIYMEWPEVGSTLVLPCFRNP